MFKRIISQRKFIGKTKNNLLCSSKINLILYCEKVAKNLEEMIYNSNSFDQDGLANSLVITDLMKMIFFIFASMKKQLIGKKISTITWEGPMVFLLCN